MGTDENLLLRQFPDAGAGLREMLLAETPAHEVTIPPFWIDRYEVTNARFHEFTRTQPECRNERIGLILLPEICANVCFGGTKRNRLFMTASQSLYAVYVETQGAHIASGGVATVSRMSS